MPKVIKSSKRFTKKSNNRVKKSGKKHTRKNHLKRIYNHNGGSPSKKLKEALSKLPVALRESIMINKKEIITSKLTNKNIDEILKDSKVIACKEGEIRKVLQKMKFNPSLINTNTGKPYKSLFQQAKRIVDKEGNTEQDIIDLIKNNSSEHIYSSTDVDIKLR